MNETLLAMLQRPQAGPSGFTTPMTNLGILLALAPQLNQSLSQPGGQTPIMPQLGVQPLVRG